MNSDLSPAAIFSPSQARQELTQVKEWGYVDGWLRLKLGGKSPPAFERTNDTLQALLALAAFNESADEERDLLVQVETRALRQLQSKVRSATTLSP